MAHDGSAGLQRFPASTPRVLRGKEPLENLQSALSEALEMNRADALAAVRGVLEEASLQA